MTVISSPQNPHLKDLRKLQRRRERERSARFAAEGEDLVAAASSAGRPPVSGYRVAGSGLGGESFLDVDANLLAQTSSLGSGARVIGVYEQRFLAAPVGPLCVYLHGVGDPGNVGTILRAALAFGASSVALGPGCADPHSPKAVRASMGAIFGVALARAAAPAELPGERVALVAHAGVPLHELRRLYVSRRLSSRESEPLPQRLPAQSSTDSEQGSPQGLTLLVGAEREGLPGELVAACEHVAHIPIRSDSLNAAMAATIALHEMTRVPTS